MSDNQGSVKLGRLLEAWDAGATKTAEEIGRAFEMLDVCGGAYLYITREAAEVMEKNGIQFDSDWGQTIPLEGRGGIRVRCRGSLMTKVISEEIPGSEQRHSRTVKYGLCPRCSGWELAVRKKMRQDAKLAEQAAKSGPRKRGFREDAAE